MSIVRVESLLAEGRRPLLAVHLPHARKARLASYRVQFGVPITFHAEVAALELHAADLALPIRAGRRELRELAYDYLEIQSITPEMPFVARVQALVRRSLGTGKSGCRDVAAALGLHPRTLQRRLRAEQSSFADVKDAVRRNLARDYLAEHELSLGQVAALLDYSEQSALTRSCRRWFGQPPRALRQAME